MRGRLRSALQEIVFFVVTLDVRHYWSNPEKPGYLIEEKWDDTVFYYIQDYEGHELKVEIAAVREYIVRQMKRAGVTVIPHEAMHDVWEGRRKMDDVLREYARKE